jgi:transcriptional regulator with XRE-family HTH domain
MFAVGKTMRFTEWLQTEMDKRGWSQSECARACDLNRAVINKLLNGKCRPQPVTLIAIARGFKIPVETAYRAAGLLPPSNHDDDDTTQELIHIFRSLQSPQRKATAIMLLKALVAEEENQLRSDGKGKQ